MTEETYCWCGEKAIVLRNGEPMCMAHATEPSNPNQGGMLTVERVILMSKVLKITDPWPELTASRAVFCNPAVEYNLRQLLKLPDDPFYITDRLRPTAVGVWCPVEEVYLPRDRKEIELLEGQAYYEKPHAERDPAIPMYELKLFAQRLKEYRGEKASE